MAKIKLFNISDLEEFFEKVNECKGEVRLIGEGLDLDLKSKLAQYFSLAKCFSNGEIHELELMVENEDDMVTLMKYTIG